jgi:hypothetical protein
MKKYIKLNMRRNFALLFIFTLTFVSCEQWIDTDINKDPDNPNDSKMEYILPTIQANLGYDLGGNDLVRTTNIWLQYFNGYARQSLAESRYSLRPGDVNNLWNSLYNGSLMDLHLLIEKATEKNSYHFRGAGRVLMAIALGNATDLWNDIPYEDAFKGEANVLNPEYQSQEQIYNTIQTLLDGAIQDLSVSSEENNIALAGDIYYDGDVEQWKKAAWALKARYALTLSEIDGNQAYTDALAYLDSASFTSNDDNMMMSYNSESARNPIYQFMDERGDINMASTFVEMLKNDGDPRLDNYVEDTDENGEYIGGTPGSEEAEGIDNPGLYIAAADAPTYLFTYAEHEFIRAEANLQLGNTSDAYDAYLTAVRASLQQVEPASDTTDYTTWWTGPVKVGESNLDLETIMHQKYISLFGTAQSYTEWRRTGYPQLTPAAAATGNIPTRYPYAQDELTYNSNIPGNPSITEKVWWDK